jgi:hypothetical protein
LRIHNTGPEGWERKEEEVMKFLLNTYMDQETNCFLVINNLLPLPSNAYLKFTKVKEKGLLITP